jgi:hypothetical protein
VKHAAILLLIELRGCSIKVLAMSDDEHKHEENSSATEVPEEALYGEATPEEIDDYLDRLEPALKNQHGARSWWHEVVDFVGMLCGFGDDLISLLASQISPQKVKWLWPNRVPLGKLTLFVGYPDKGKSLAGTYVTAITSTGGDWYSSARNEVLPGEVLIFASEDDLGDTAVPRLMAAGADLEKVRFAKMVSTEQGATQQEREMRLDQDMSAIRKALEKSPNIRLIIIEPVSNYLGAGKMVDEQSVRRVLGPLQKLASDTGVAILGIMHLNKKEGLSAINRRRNGLRRSCAIRVAVCRRTRESRHLQHAPGQAKHRCS